VVAQLSRPLADAEIPILAVSTYDTDIILFKRTYRDAAVAALGAVADTSKL